MADFGSIYSMANRPTSPAPDLAQSMGTVASIQHLGQQNQLGQQQIAQGQMQNQQMQQQLQDATELRQTLKEAISSGQNPVQAVQKLASPAAQGWVKQYTEMAMNQTKLSKEQFDLASNHLAKVGGDVIAASQAPGATPQQVAQIIQGHVQQGNIPPDKAQALIQTIPQDPAALPTWGMTQGATLGASKELLGLFTPQVHMVDQGTSTQPVAINPTQATIKNIGAPIEKDIGPGDLKKFASDIGALKDDGSVDMSNPKVKAKIHAMTTNMATVIQGGAGGGGASFDPSQPLSPADESQARYAAQTGARETPSMRNPGALQRNARAEYLAQQGGGDIAQNKIQFKTQQDAQNYFTTGAGADAFRQQETILHHAQVFGQIYDALNNGNTQLANKLGNEFNVQFGADQATNAKIVGQVMSAEVGKYLAGNQGSKDERAELAALIPTFSSPQQAKGGLQTLATLVQGQRASWTAQRDAALKGQVPWQQQPANPQAPAGAAPAAAALTNLHTNGKQTIGWNGTKWVDQATGQEVK